MVREVYCWEFEYYDTTQAEWLECTYYTWGDNRQAAIDAFKEDEPDVDNDWSVQLDEVVTEERMKEVYGLEMVL